ncbi:Ubiquitin-activating enzyme E1 [Giardia duodenalis]|uniref:NEDD8-activating enzyme E1 catalytic subunit n=1 Tax=Giardia intestinalis TaxID=5741 RepID=V6TSL6_GIAIN|nr:Ubiquitin-activating enzyme E1 [Giardia intestinalis]
MYTIAVVGLGGSGCEVIRSLMHAFKEADISNMQVKLMVVDRDTISEANLGKQALYNSESVGEFKSDVARAFIETQGYQVEAYSTDAARPAFVTKLATAAITFLCVDNVDARRKIIPALLLAQKTVLDVGSEGLAGSIRLYSSQYPCFYCTSWMYPKRKRPLCGVPGIPKNAEDCILIAACAISESNASNLQLIMEGDSYESVVVSQANELSEIHNLGIQIAPGDVTNTLQQVVSTPFHISGLVASYAVSLWCKHFMVSMCCNDINEFLENTWPKECLWMISTYNGLYIHALVLERQKDCSCNFLLPDTNQKESYNEVISKYINIPDFTVVVNQRIVYSHSLLPESASVVPSEGDLEGTVFIYANERLVYAKWIDYKWA